MMMADPEYCMSSYLMYRMIVDKDKTFSADISPRFFDLPSRDWKVETATDLGNYLKKRVRGVCGDGSAALALSGGIDSAILARYMPEGSTAITFKCTVPGIEVTNEVDAAAGYAKACGLNHEVIEIFWEDFSRLLPDLLSHRGAPIHSIEVQIYKAALLLRSKGFKSIIFGEAADSLYGGHDLLHSKDWTLSEFIKRYSYVDPESVLSRPQVVRKPIEDHTHDGIVDTVGFMRSFYFRESLSSFFNACSTAGVECICPYAETDPPDLDMQRIRGGDSKYIVRELFRELYPGWSVPAKIPLPRPMNEWLKTWEGPSRPEFLDVDIGEYTGDQRWLIYCLEFFLNNHDLNRKSA